MFKKIWQERKFYWIAILILGTISYVTHHNGVEYNFYNVILFFIAPTILYIIVYYLIEGYLKRRKERKN